MNITEDAKKRVEWLDKRIILSEQQKEYIEFQIKEAVTNALRQGQTLPLNSVSVSSSYEIDFGSHCRVVMDISNNEPNVISAIGGWGDNISLADIEIKKL